VNHMLMAGAFVVLIGALFRSHVQAWEATLGPHELVWVKVLVLGSGAVFIVTLVALTLTRRRSARLFELPKD